MATRDYWNMRGLHWLESLEDMAANVDSEDATTRLTQFERNLLQDLRIMVVKPEDEPSPPNLAAENQERIASFRQQAADFFVDNLDENEWDIASTPMVSLSEHGAHVQLWKWFPNEDEA
jgi:hypothetical protein